MKSVSGDSGGSLAAPAVFREGERGVNGADPAIDPILSAVYGNGQIYFTNDRIHNRHIRVEPQVNFNYQLKRVSMRDGGDADKV